MTEPKTGELFAVLANAVAEAKHALTVPEQRLILWMVAQIEREDDALKEHTLSIQEMKEILGRDVAGPLYTQTEQAVKRLQSRVLEIKTGKKERVSFNWLHRARYLDGKGEIQLRFHDDLKPVLLQLKARFCQIPLNAVFRLRGGYAIRWMEMLYSRQHVGKFTLSVEELRDWLNIEEGELQRIDNLQARAIAYPQKELNQKSPLTFTYKPTKAGRRITGWVFTVKKNKPRPLVIKKRKRETAPKAERIRIEDIQALKEQLSRNPAENHGESEEEDHKFA